MEIKKKKAQMEQKRMLLEQMKTDNYKRLKETLQSKEKVNTNFGPEENELTIQEHNDIIKRNIGDIKNELEKQIYGKCI